ncbi:MAG: riboflavin synthase, partial [Phycisphaerae bacterium]
GRRFAIELTVAPGQPSWAMDCELGASVAINGVCLTVTAKDTNRLEFDVINETLDKTNLGAYRVGDALNLERSLRVGDRLDGHFVQ